MTKQQEIREVIDGVAIGEIKPAAALRILSDLGVVLKVERELPINKHRFPPTIIEDGITIIPSVDFNAIGVYHDCQQDMLKWHNDSLEPLIKE